MASPRVDVKDLLEADGTVFETPVSSTLLTVAEILQYSCMCMRQCVAIQQPSNVTYQQVPCSSSGVNPRRACAARVTVVVLCVCVCVCVCVFVCPGRSSATHATKRQTRHTHGLSILLAPE